MPDASYGHNTVIVIGRSHHNKYIYRKYWVFIHVRVAQFREIRGYHHLRINILNEADLFSPIDSFTGLAADKKQMYHDARTAISYAVSGDTVTINVGLVGAPGGREFTFKLGEHYDSADLDGSPMKVTVLALVLIQQYVHIFLFSVSFWRPQGFWNFWIVGFVWNLHQSTRSPSFLSKS